MKEGPLSEQPLSRDTLLAYLEGKLSKKEQHVVEKRLLDDPFEAAALEGLQKLPENQRQALLNELDQTIDKRLTDRTKRPAWWIWSSGVAASLLLLWVAWLALNPSLTQENASATMAMESSPDEPLPEVTTLEESTSDRSELLKQLKQEVQQEAEEENVASNTIKEETTKPIVASKTASAPDIEKEVAVLEEVEDYNELASAESTKEEDDTRSSFSDTLLKPEVYSDVARDELADVEIAETERKKLDEEVNGLIAAESRQKKARKKEFQRQPDAADQLDLVYDLYRNQEYKLVSKMIEPLLSQNSKDPVLLFMAARSAAEQNRFKEARQFVQLIPEKTFSEVDFAKLETLLNREYKKEALQQFDRYVLVGKTLILRR